MLVECSSVFASAGTDIEVSLLVWMSLFDLCYSFLDGTVHEHVHA